MSTYATLQTLAHACGYKIERTRERGATVKIRRTGSDCESTVEWHKSHAGAFDAIQRWAAFDHFAKEVVHTLADKELDRLVDLIGRPTTPNSQLCRANEALRERWRRELARNGSAATA